MERLMIFIDGGNFFWGVTDSLKLDFYSINFDTFIQKITNKRKFIRAYYYTVRPTDSSTMKPANASTERSSDIAEAL